MRHPTLLSTTALIAGLMLGGFSASAVDAAETVPAPAVATEAYDLDNRKIPVTPKKDLTFKADDPVEVATRELWYSRHDGRAWGDWQKHGIAFNRDTTITWAPPEGHWRVYIRRITTAGLAKPAPTAATVAHGEFVIDRSAPTVAIGYPGAKQKLRGGDKYTVKWEVADAYLRNQPIAIRWSRDGSVYETVAENLSNSGSYEWTVPMAMTTSGQLQILATDKATNVGTAEVAGIIVDSVRPKGRVVGPAISAKGDINVDVEVDDGSSPSGLAAARLWVSTDDGGSWTEGPFIQEPFKAVGWKAASDGRFRLAVVATDGAGNQTAIPKGKAENQFVLTVDTTAPVVLQQSAIGIVDAAAAKANNRRDFKPGDRVQVPFIVKDANLLPSSVTVSVQYDAGRPWLELGKGLATDTAFRFEIAKDAPATKAARIKVSAMDTAGNIGEAISGESFTIQTEVVEAPVNIGLDP